MGAVSNLLTSAGLNIAFSSIFLGIFAFFSRQSFNGRVYFTKWYATDVVAARKKLNKSDKQGKNKKIVETNIKSYFFVWEWVKEVLGMPEEKLIQHAGLDSAIYLRLLLLGLKMFIPIAVVGFLVLMPVTFTDNELERLSKTKKDFVYSDIDKLTIANVADGSDRLWCHVVLSWSLCFWVLYLLHREYSNVAKLRFKYMGNLPRNPDQFTILVRQIPSTNDSIKKTVDGFFKTNHPDNYLFNQVVYNANKLTSLINKKESLINSLIASNIRLEKHPSSRPMTRTKFFGLFGEKVDAIQYYTKEIEDVKQKIIEERKRVLSDESFAMSASFVSFDKRRAASLAAQTQQCHDATKFITEWAPEPKDVAWPNLSIKYTELKVRQLLISVSLFFLVFFYIFPVSFVQSLANLEALKANLKFLRPVLEVRFINNIIQGFLPGLALKIFLAILPLILTIMSNIEGWVSKSTIERKSAGKYYYFMIINVFFGSVLTGSLFQRLKSITSDPKSIPELFGSAIPSKATFFQTYIMVDGWLIHCSGIVKNICTCVISY